MNTDFLRTHLLRFLREDQVSIDPAVLKTHATDKWYAANAPDVVVFAESTADVAQVLEFAQLHRVPVTPRGAGVGYVGGCVPVQAGIALSVARMNRILEINVEDGVAVVQPGVITGDLQDAVKRVGWYYPRIRPASGSAASAEMSPPTRAAPSA